MADLLIIQFDVEDIGIDHSQYFTGRGTAFTPYDHVEVGIGTNAYEAFEDAAGGLAQMGYDVEPLENPFNSADDFSDELGYNHASYCPFSEDFEPEDDDDISAYECICDFVEDSELWYHVAIYVRNDQNFEPRKGDVLYTDDGDITFVDRTGNKGAKNNKPFWSVFNWDGEAFFARDPFIDGDERLAWRATQYDHKELERRLAVSR